MRAKRSRPYAAAKYSSTSGCHRSFGLNVYRPASAAGAAAAEGEGEEEEESIRGDGGRPRGEGGWGGDGERGSGEMESTRRGVELWKRGG
jgi:hypothetical protein